MGSLDLGDGCTVISPLSISWLSQAHRLGSGSAEDMGTHRMPGMPPSRSADMGYAAAIFNAFACSLRWRSGRAATPCRDHRQRRGDDASGRFKGRDHVVQLTLRDVSAIDENWARLAK